MSKPTTSYVHVGTIGDVWASLPAVRECCRLQNKKADFYLMKNIPGQYAQGITHPTRDEKGNMVTLNQEAIDKMIPLLESQPFINKAAVHEEGMDIDIDLTRITSEFVNMPYHPLSYWYFYIYPDLFCDVSLPYIEVPDTDKDFGVKGKIIIARTERYHNMQGAIDYSFIKEWEDECVFSGNMREYNNFCMTYDLNIPLLVVNNFLELAQAVKQAKGLISNQTQIFQLAEGLKTPRAVELCSGAPNVTVQGKNGYEYYRQYALELFFHTFRLGSKEAAIDFYTEQIKKIQATTKQPEQIPDQKPELSVDSGGQ